VLDRITPLVLTYNEEANIRRLLESLAWAKRVVVVDSESADGTRKIAAEFANTDFVVRSFDELARQWNFALAETGIESEWILALDADYVLPSAFVDELGRLDPAADIDGYRARFRYCIEGVPLRGTLYPPVTVLFRGARARFAQDGHAHRVKLPGRIENLATPLLHDDRKPLERWFSSQVKYMKLEAAKLRAMRFAELGWTDRTRKLMVVAPIAAFFYCLFVKGNLLDGRRGLMYALQRATAEAILSIYLIEAALRPGRADE
jgi:glycosyltransferase involved in cell wall biosynthesis